MRPPHLLLPLMFLFAGCVGSPGDGDKPPTPFPDTILVPWAKVDAAATLKDLRTFSEAYPFRQDANENHKASRGWLERQLKDAGLEALRHTFQSSGFEGVNVLGFKWGIERDRWVVVGAHYDVVDTAAHGTYDDGSGTAMVVRLAAAYAKIPTQRTLVFALFDSEEKGLLGSRAFVKDVRLHQFIHNGTVEAMIDLDMVGITHPHPAALVGWENSDEMKALSEAARKAVGVPDAKMKYRRPLISASSDGVAFMREGIPTIYYWSNWDEVVMKDGTAWPAGSYPWWHQADTYATMLAMAGDEATLQAGFQTALDVTSRVLADLAGGAPVDTRA